MFNYPTNLKIEKSSHLNKLSLVYKRKNITSIEKPLKPIPAYAVKSDDSHPLKIPFFRGGLIKPEATLLMWWSWLEQPFKSEHVVPNPKAEAYI